MSEINDPLAWVARAEEDYALARSSLRRRRPLTYGACFHAQQCAEKYLKAAMVARGEAFPKTHDLLALRGLCARVGLDAPVANSELALLSSYAVQARYPDWQTTPDEAKHALEIAGAVRRAVRRLLKLK